MRLIFLLFLIISWKEGYSKIRKKKISRISLEVINDLIHSNDFTPQKMALAEEKKFWIHKKYPDSVDTSITKKFRISYWGTQMDTIFISTSTENRYIEELKKTDENFDSRDMKFMNTQINSKINLNWNKRIVGARILEQEQISMLFKKKGIDAGWKTFYSLYHNCYYNFSRPIFNKNYTKGIIEIGEHCGALDGKGGVYLIEKQNGKWNITKLYGVKWIS